MDFSLFYFADDSSASTDRYQLLIEGARFADSHGFAAVWTPERHFHAVGGPYPNPAVTGAAVAAVTERIAIRAGSVVAPLHHPVRIAEEWAVVDNLSGGRAGIAFASGWHAVDFVLRPENYANRRQVLTDTVGTVRRLWRGENVELVDGTGAHVQVRVYPAPVQPDVPIWLTSVSSPATFQHAGELGAGVLTNLLAQDLDGLAEKISIYRRAFRAQGGAGNDGHVALMLHTFLGANREEVKKVVREPFSNFLRNSIDLIIRAPGDGHPSIKPEDINPEDLNFLVKQSFDRYFETGGLFGTVEDGISLLTRLAEIGVDEVACFIDFIGDTNAVFSSLDYLEKLRTSFSSGATQNRKAD
ncbi:MAG: LLM class flavin-dependent oxidoreductase [Actinomycetota bacterium]|nr:LLM class flavin-dependent oxidoreductase [Actinomycetota bacterium]